MTRLDRAADRLATGSRAYARRLGARATACCARGRRHDLTGWRAALGPILRAAVLIIAALIACLIVRRRPSLMWLLTGWWTIASWRAGKPADEPEEAAEEDATAPSSGDVREATLEWIWQQIGDRQGVHLRDLLAHAQTHGMFAGMEVTDLRGHLERWDIPVRKRVRVRSKGITVGIHRDDLTAPSLPSPAPAAQRAPDREPHAY